MICNSSFFFSSRRRHTRSLRDWSSDVCSSVLVEGFDGGFQPRVLRGRLSRAAATARRSFYVIDITEILVHWYAGRLQHELAASLGVDRKTIRKYVAPALAAGIAPGGPARSQEQWAGLVRDWFPELVDTR